MTGPVIRRRLARVGRRGVRRIAPALALLSLCISAEAQPPDILSSAYEAAIGAYGSGDREKAVSEAARWPESLVREQVRVLAAAWREARASTHALRRIPLKAALMLHTDSAQRRRRDGLPAQHHEVAALAIARMLKDDPLYRTFARRWYEAAAGLALGETRWDDALTRADEGLREFPDSAEMLLVVGLYVDVFVTEGGRPVVGLAASDFELKDNGGRQPVEVVAVEPFPLTTFLVLDTSGSVNGDKLEKLRAAGRALLGGLRAGDEASLVTFDHEVRVRVPPTSDRERLERALLGIRPGGATALFDALYAGTMLASGRGRSLLVVFTDGEDNLSYVLRFEPGRARREGLHELEVTLTRRKGKVHCRKAYFVGPGGGQVWN